MCPQSVGPSRQLTVQRRAAVRERGGRAGGRACAAGSSSRPVGSAGGVLPAPATRAP
jgi:hypothetical protein